jgi:MFS-type transporter involved in bile tolerance (Atg22 family)
MALSLLILVKDNFKAFTVIHIMIISGCLLAGTATWLFDSHTIGPVAWMSLSGLGLYFAYIPYNAIFFERMIATFKGNGNVGFVMYIADAAGYLGSVSILFLKEFGTENTHGWMHFFKQGLYSVAIVGGIAATCSYFYFLQKKNQHKKTSPKIQILPI